MRGKEGIKGDRHVRPIHDRRDESNRFCLGACCLVVGREGNEGMSCGVARYANLNRANLNQENLDQENLD